MRPDRTEPVLIGTSARPAPARHGVTLVTCPPDRHHAWTTPRVTDGLLPASWRYREHCHDGCLFAAPTIPKKILDGVELKDKMLPEYVQLLQRPNLDNPGYVAHLTLNLGSKIERPNRVVLTRHGAPCSDTSSLTDAVAALPSSTPW